MEPRSGSIANLTGPNRMSGPSSLHGDSMATKKIVEDNTSLAPDRDVTGPRSLTRLLGLFDVLSMTPDGMSLAELNVTLESPKSSLLNLLRPLVAEGYLIHSAGQYRLGPSIFRLAASVMSAWNFPR